jgi:hypothetical protein
MVSAIEPVLADLIRIPVGVDSRRELSEDLLVAEV